MNDRTSRQTTPSCSDAYVLRTTGTERPRDAGPAASGWLKYAVAAAVFVAVFGLVCAEAAAQDEAALLIPVEGTLTDSAEEPLEGDVEVTFSLYAGAGADEPFWSATRDLTVEEGAFSTYLGSIEPLKTGDFADHRAPYLGLRVEDDAEMDRWPIGHVPYAAVARRADDATTLQGMEPDELGGGGAGGSASSVDYDDTETELGADDSQEAIEALADRVDQLEQQIGGSDGDLDETLSNHESRLTELEEDVADHENRMSTLEDDFTDLDELASGFDGRISELENTTAPMSRMDVGGDDSVVFEGVNVHVRNGKGSTDADPNGRGNLIVGYDEGSGDKTGSHNIVYGTNATYTSYGGLVGGDNNEISGAHASVVGGNANTSSGEGAVVVSGTSNEATGNYTAISAGNSNQTTANLSSIVSGWNNQTQGSYSAIVSGQENSTNGLDATVLTGTSNAADGSQSAVVGGANNTATGNEEVIAGN